MRSQIRSTKTCFLVSDLDKSLAFYIDVLGFREPAKFGEPECFAMANRDEFDVMFSLAQRAEQIHPNGPNGVWDLYIVVENLDSEMLALEAAKCPLQAEPRETFYSMRELEVVDPDGYLICLAQEI